MIILYRGILLTIIKEEKFHYFVQLGAQQKNLLFYYLILFIGKYKCQNSIYLLENKANNNLFT